MGRGVRVYFQKRKVSCFQVVLQLKFHQHDRHQNQESRLASSIWGLPDFLQALPLQFAPVHHGGFALIQEKKQCIGQILDCGKQGCCSSNLFLLMDFAPIPKYTSQGSSWCRKTSLPPSKAFRLHTNFSWKIHIEQTSRQMLSFFI